MWVRKTGSREKIKVARQAGRIINYIWGNNLEDQEITSRKADRISTFFENFRRSEYFIFQKAENRYFALE